jgi:hypothetical protein
MKVSKSQAALAIVAWTAIMLALFAAFVIFGVWGLVPNNPDLTTAKNMSEKAEIMAAFAVALIAFVALAKWCFRKRNELR